MTISAGQPVPTEDEQGGSQVSVIQEGEEEEDGKDVRFVADKTVSAQEERIFGTIVGRRDEARRVHETLHSTPPLQPPSVLPRLFKDSRPLSRPI